jgi:hypothetical protein
MEGPMTNILRTKDWDVEQRLRELDLSIAELHAVGRAAYIAKADCSKLHPPTYPGTAAWATAVLTLRDKKLPHKWRYSDPGNFSVTINDRGRFYIVVATGDQLAGRSHGKEPTTKSPKGMKTEAAVAANRQMSLFPEAIPEEVLLDAELGTYQAFFLLLNISDRQVYIELSSPSDMDKGKIVGWDERIILPPLDLDPTTGLTKGGDGSGNGFAPDVDVDVQRIA